MITLNPSVLAIGGENTLRELIAQLNANFTELADAVPLMGYDVLSDAAAILPADCHNKLILLEVSVTSITIEQLSEVSNPVGTFVRILRAEQAVSAMPIQAGDEVTLVAVPDLHTNLASNAGAELFLLHRATNNWLMWGNVEQPA